MTISLNNVSFAYPEAPDKTVLNVIDWSVASGEHVFIQGPSGGGKSTLLNILGGIISPRTGEVKVLDHPLHTMSLRQCDRFRADNIGYVFQQFNLIPYLNAVENVQLAARFSQQKNNHIKNNIDELLNQLNISKSDRQQRSDRLSIGQQQRVAIARAFINKPKLLLADEPTSSLDQKNRDNFITRLMALAEKQGTTVVFVSHDLSLAQHFSRVDSLADINTLPMEC